MQTFIPFPSFKESASVLDNKRLCKQIVEAGQILSIITNPNGLHSVAWSNHPAVLMWVGHPVTLSKYILDFYSEYLIRFPGKVNSYQSERLLANKFINNQENPPYWLFDIEMMISHQSNLLRKDYKYYTEFFSVEENLDYIWPTYYSDWQTKTLSKEGIKKLLKSSKRKGLL